MIIAVLSVVAQGESEQKSNSLKWSYRRRWKHGLGIHPNWALLGYRQDEQLKWVIVEEEAEVVRAIYKLYLDGYPSTHIADLLTKNGIPTVKGKPVWTGNSVLGILRNEKYCGDALCQKTVTVDLFTHKSVKNDGLEPQYFIEGHHEAIIDKKDWLLVQQIRKERRYSRQRKEQTRKPKIVIKGLFSGFMVIDPNWEPEHALAVLTREEHPPIKTTTPLLEDEYFTVEKE